MSGRSVSVRLFAAAREAAGRDEVEVDPGETPRVADVRRALLEECPELEPILGASRIAVDAVFATDDDAVGPGAEVAVIPPVGGG